VTPYRATNSDERILYGRYFLITIGSTAFVLLFGRIQIRLWCRSIYPGSKKLFLEKKQYFKINAGYAIP